MGFPGGSVVKNPPANARNTGLIPGPGRSHVQQSNQVRMPQLLSLCSGARESQLLQPHATTTKSQHAREPRVCNERSLCAVTKSSPPLTPTRENCAAKMTQNSQK